MADRQKNVVPIKIRIENPDKFLKPDMSAKVTFQEKDADQSNLKFVIQIPRTAVVDNNGKNTVCVFEGDQLLEREVQLGAVEGEYVTIEKGLVVGEKVVVEGTRHLKPN